MSKVKELCAQMLKRGQQTAEVDGIKISIKRCESSNIDIAMQGPR